MVFPARSPSFHAWLGLAAALLALAASAAPKPDAAVPARRIVSLGPGPTEILFALGCGGALIMRDEFSIYPAAAQKIPAIAGYRTPLEPLVTAQPDLVVCSFPAVETRAALNKLGVPLLVLDPRQLPDVLDNIRALGDACGKPREAGELADRLAGRIAAVDRALAGKPRPRVYYEMDASDPLHPWTIGDDSYGGDVLQRAGASNVFARGPQPWFQVSLEAVIEADPDYVILGDFLATENPQALETVQRRPGWSKLRAVQAGKVVTLEAAKISVPGPRLVDALEELAHALHPGEF